MQNLSCVNVKTGGNTTNLMNHLKRNHLEVIETEPVIKKMHLNSESNVCYDLVKEFD